MVGSLLFNGTFSTNKRDRHSWFHRLLRHREMERGLFLQPKRLHGAIRIMNDKFP